MRAFAAKCDDLSSIPRIHVIENTEVVPLPGHWCTVALVHSGTCMRLPPTKYVGDGVRVVPSQLNQPTGFGSHTGSA